MEDTILEVRDLRKVYARKGAADVVAVDGVSFTVGRGESVGLVGGSGCGKSTAARLITCLEGATAGQVLLDGIDVFSLPHSARRQLARHVQMVFQNPVGSFDPRRTLGAGVAEGLCNFGVPAKEAHEQAVALMERCGLPPELASRYAREVSGGQCQRAAIARALALDPPLVILDEATSALDVTVQAQVIGLLAGLRRERGTAFLFICHDLALVQGFCDRVLVMQSGRIVEQGPAAQVIADPQHPYTRQLLDAVL